MVFTRVGAPLRERELPIPRPGPGQVLLRGAARAASAAPTCTCSTARSRSRQPPRVLGHQIVGDGARARRARPSASRRRRRAPSRRASASACRGWDGPTATASTAERAREPLPARALHRPRHRRRLRRVHGRRRALLLPAPRRLPRRAGRAAAVRRPDRLPRAAHVRRGAARRPVRLRRLRAHHRPGRALAGTPRCSPSRAPATTARRRSRASSAPSGRVPRTSRRRSRSTPRSSSPRSGPLVPVALRAVAPGGTVVCAGIHMSDIPAFPYELPVGGASAALGRQPHPRRRATSCSSWPPQVPVHTHVTTYPLQDAQRGARRPPRGPFHRRRRDRPLTPRRGTAAGSTLTTNRNRSERAHSCIVHGAEGGRKR